MRGLTTRRGLMGAALDGVAVGGAAPFLLPDSPDAPLLAALAEFDGLEIQVAEIMRGAIDIADEEKREAICEPLSARQRELLDFICRTPAQTVDGIRQRAISFRLWDGGGHVGSEDNTDDYTDRRLLGALIRDLTEVRT